MSVNFLYFWFLINVSFYFRPFQLSGVRKTIFIVSLFFYLLDSVYRIGIQAGGISHSKLTALQHIPPTAIFFLSTCVTIYVIKKHFCFGPLIHHLKFIVLFVVPYVLTLGIAELTTHSICPAYNKQNTSGQFLIAMFAPIIVVVIKATGRICIQRLWCRVSHPGNFLCTLGPYVLWISDHAETFASRFT